MVKKSILLVSLCVFLGLFSSSTDAYAARSMAKATLQTVVKVSVLSLLGYGLYLLYNMPLTDKEEISRLEELTEKVGSVCLQLFNKYGQYIDTRIELVVLPDEGLHQLYTDISVDISSCMLLIHEMQEKIEHIANRKKRLLEEGEAKENSQCYVANYTFFEYDLEMSIGRFKLLIESLTSLQKQIEKHPGYQFECLCRDVEEDFLWERIGYLNESLLSLENKVCAI